MLTLRYDVEYIIIEIETLVGELEELSEEICRLIYWFFVRN